MFGTIKDIHICGMHTVVPDNRVNNFETYCSQFGEKKLKRQIRMTGMEERCVAGEGVTSALLCEVAAETLLGELGWDRNTIRAVLYVTETPNYVLPSTAFQIQKQLGIGEDCVVYDINLGCSGWIVGMQTISSIMRGIEPTDGGPVRALLLTGSISTSHVAADDFATAMLFGDAGAATALEISAQDEGFVYMQKSDGTGYQHIFMESLDGSVQMNGPAVFEFTINQVVDSVKKFTEHFDIRQEGIDYYVFHQAQKFIVDNMMELLACPPEKVLSSYASYGNTAAAAIPLTICLHRDTLRKKERMSILAAGFGVGLSWGALHFHLDTDHIMGISILEKGEAEGWS